ncbi:hypothetical protein BLA29_002651 [Euroglyphus maynei]|uniref:PH domain-containing protein n=1 Tax=Euroglyphus maynei TaxID=6958 RepID=A0A1Y3AN75_EURMA|nr:hypothetical protein BLA29_002651 [Euroglyphus maynei]
MFIYRDDKDPVERSVINLTQARVECSEQQRQMLCVENAFSVITRHAGYLFRTSTAREMYNWLYSINPLYAGQLMCEWARAHHATTTNMTNFELGHPPSLATIKQQKQNDNSSGSSSDNSSEKSQPGNLSSSKDVEINVQQPKTSL